MEYGSNILSKQPADWQLTNATMTGGSISLGASGKALIELHEKDLQAVPSSMKLILIAEPFVDEYYPSAYAVLRVVDTAGANTIYTVPIVETVSGACSVIIPTTGTSYSKLYFYIVATQPIVIRDWSLSGPIDSDFSSQIESVKEELSKLLADYNTSPVTIGQVEDTIALISARLLQNTDVSGHLQFTYHASNDCTITVRLKDNEGTELFAPIIYDVRAGRGSVGVPHAYLKRLVGMHTFSVTAQCSAGTITFYPRSILYTIEAGTLATRTMDVGLDLRDIALQQLPGEKSPSSIYAIGIDDDRIARVRYRAYNENAAIIWEPAFGLTEAVHAAIEFDGSFVRRTGDDYHTLECEDHPYAFWVSPRGDLYMQHGPDESTRRVLAYNVSGVSAVRGFKSTLYPEQDQGLIVAYIVAGEVYYRNYCRQADGTYMWEPARVLKQLGNNVISVQVHRLNDYRVGFVAQTENNYTWLISDRTYVGAAVAPEHVKVDHAEAGSLAIYPVGYEVPTPSVATSVSEDFLSMDIQCSLPMHAVGEYPDVFVDTGESTTEVSVSRMTVLGSVIHITLNGRPRNGVLFIRPKPNRLKAHVADCGYIPIFDTLRFDFTESARPIECVDISPAVTANIAQRLIAPILNDMSAEHVVANFIVSANVSQKLIGNIASTTRENVFVSFAVTSTITQSYTGTAPI